MRGPGLLIRIVGWLLTPLVAWAASLWGAWIMLRRVAAFDNPRSALYAAFGAGLVLAVLAMLAWLELLRRSPRLRQSLHVDREGLPVIEEAASTPPSRPEDEP
jgi:hypothetical protein